MTKSEIIEINGRRYDTRSGAVLNTSNDKLRKSADEDDSTKIQVTVTAPSIAEDDRGSVEVPQSSWRKPGKTHKVARNKTPHRTQKATTLLRSAVKKPELKKESKLSAVSTALQTKISDKAEKITVNVSHTKLSEHAKNIEKSSLISKFSTSASSYSSPKLEHIHVKPNPETRYQPRVSEFLAKTAVPENPFDTAVERAHSHEQPAPARPRLSPPQLAARFTMSIVIIVALISTILYIASPRIDVSLAAYQSTVSASMPSWLPAGYSYRPPVDYATGKVVLTFSNGSQTIRLGETNTTWNSNGLLNNYVSNSGESYTPLISNGQIVYVFGNGDATWIKGNVWYQLASSADLTNSDIQNIAANS